MIRPRRVLQIGYGAFGETHLRAWQALGMAHCLTIADPRPAALSAARTLAPEVDVVADFRQALARCEVVDIVTPSDTHHAIAAAALDAGKHVLIEKPMVVALAQARDLAARAARQRCVVRGGYYFRYHPKTLALRRLLAEGALGQLRFLNGRFAGLKRTRADSGALHNDAVHFLDLFVWLIGQTPHSVYAVTRDHFGRGLEDFALLVLQFEGGAVGQIETGYTQPGRWPDTVVPGAVTSKEIAVSGSGGIVELDYAGETMSYRTLRHVVQDGVWRPEMSPAQDLDVPPAAPVEVVTEELRAFLAAIDGRVSNSTLDGGVAMAGLLDAAAKSAATGQAVRLNRA